MLPVMSVTPQRAAPLAALVVGAGPAGLASAACLKQRGIEAVVLEAGPSVGTSWRNHYDRLHLHTTKEGSHLPGVPFDEALPRYVSRADFVAYLEAYAARFSIVPRAGEAVRRIRAGEGQGQGGFVVESTKATYRARAVVVATGTNRLPNPARLSEQERFRGTLLHSSGYRNGDAFAGKEVLVVGAGNSGAEIALDLAERGARPTLAVRSPVNVVPRDLLGMPIQRTSIRLQKAPLKLADGIGRLAGWLAFGDLPRLGFPRPALGPISSIRLHHRIPLIDVGTIAAIKRGKITVRPGVSSFTETGVVFADGHAVAFDAVVLATGFRAALGDFLEVPGVLADDGTPRDWRGGGSSPHLFFVGYDIVPTGQLRTMASRAEEVAAAIAGQPS
jgi:cation diffusion facilitator CzcD-associated flavoprotein CzcO